MKRRYSNFDGPFVTMILLVVAVFISAKSSVAQSLTGWTLVWSDEFSGTTLDAAKWGLELNEGDAGDAVYTNRAQNLFVANGNLVLQAQKESYNGKQYTSTQISTRNKGFWKYCRIDVRAKLPYGQGMWPAIWMMPNNPAYGGWPRSGEIDIMENLGKNTRLDYTTIHYGASNESSQGTYTVPANQTLSDSFHVYTMVWDSGSFAFYLDSAHNYYNLKSWSPDNVAFPKPFDQPFFLMFDLAVGGSWGGPADSTTSFPQQMQVDWVRVYQRQTTSAVIRDGNQESTFQGAFHTIGNTIVYVLTTGEVVSADLCDVSGKHIASLTNRYQSPGTYRLDIPRNKITGGLYVCRMALGSKVESQRVVLK